MKAAFLVMWSFWGIVFLMQMVRGKSWIDLFVVVAVLTLVLGMLVALSVPTWIVVAAIVGVHVAWAIGAIISGRKKKSPLHQVGDN